MNTEKPHRGGEREANQEPREDGEALPPPPPPPPQSSTSSPSHDFSFTISVLPSPIPSPNLIKCSETTTPSIAMAPPDDIFFHGHLLPLHFLSYPTFSPRPSDISIENLSLPLDHLRGDASLKHQNLHGHGSTEAKGRTRFRSLSSFFGLGKWRKASNVGEVEENTKKKKKKKKKQRKNVFDVSRFLKKYASMVEPFFFFKWEREKRDLLRRPYSFTGHSNPKEKAGWRRTRSEFSAPASMRTSPTNSGVLSMACNPSDESTMEELQNAIQAAITHCKNSAARKEERCDG